MPVYAVGDTATLQILVLPVSCSNFSRNAFRAGSIFAGKSSPVSDSKRVTQAQAKNVSRSPTNARIRTSWHLFLVMVMLERVLAVSVSVAMIVVCVISMVITRGVQSELSNNALSGATLSLLACRAIRQPRPPKTAAWSTKVLHYVDKRKRYLCDRRVCECVQNSEERIHVSLQIS
jgi:hypothetical protein